ncbi:HNH endonuclease [Bradyrhizobium sp. USDA 4452]
MSRTVAEWIGKTDDSRPPPHVRLRIFERHGGRCHFSDRRIMPGDHWDVDHVKALINGGENRESNMAPILRGKPHKEKTAQDVAEKSKVYRKRAKHVGAMPAARQKIKSRGFERSKAQHTASSPIEKWRGF